MRTWLRAQFLKMSAEPGRKKAYSSDIGWRVVWGRLALSMSFRDIALHLQIATSTAQRIYTRFELTGDVQPVNRSRQCRVLDDHHELLLIALVMENPCLYLHEMCHQMNLLTGHQVSGSTVCRILRRNGLTRKKVQIAAKQRSVEYRAYFMSQALQFSSDYFVWVDETGSDARNHIRKFGYAMKGIPPVCHRIVARGKRISAIAAISNDGLLGVELVNGTVNGDTFADFIRGTLIPEMEPFNGSPKKSILIMDNCSIHHIQQVQDLLNDAGILVFFYLRIAWI